MLFTGGRVNLKTDVIGKLRKIIPGACARDTFSNVRHAIRILIAIIRDEWATGFDRRLVPRYRFEEQFRDISKKIMSERDEIGKR